MPGVIDKKAVQNIEKCKLKMEKADYRLQHEESYKEVKEWIGYYLRELKHVDEFYENRLKHVTEEFVKL